MPTPQAQQPAPRGASYEPLDFSHTGALDIVPLASAEYGAPMQRDNLDAPAFIPLGGHVSYLGSAIARPAQAVRPGTVANVWGAAK